MSGTDKQMIIFAFAKTVNYIKTIKSALCSLHFVPHILKRMVENYCSKWKQKGLPLSFI